jgi:thioredoxin reductase (NADPH)
VAFDYDVVVVGAGPAGITAGLHLRRAGRSVVVLERDLFGGALQHTDWIADYPECPEGITGANLASKLIEEATAAGVQIESADATEIELFSKSRIVACSDGRAFSCGVVILAGGTSYAKLGMPNEERFKGRGVVDCTPCDGGFFVGKPVVVYGTSEYARRDARYLEQLGCNVTVLSPDEARITAIEGSDRVEALSVTRGSAQERMPAAALLVRTAVEPNTEWLSDAVDLSEDRRVETNAEFETSERYVLACGDIRAGARASVANAVQDGAAAAARALALLTP